MRKLKFLEHVFSRILWKGMISIFAIGTFTLILNLFLISDLRTKVFTTTTYCSRENVVIKTLQTSGTGLLQQAQKQSGERWPWIGK